MTEQECLKRMVAPGTRRPGKYREGVIQIHLTRACDKACFNCTQGSNLGGKTTFMPPHLFETAVKSLKGYFGVVGIFGGNPALHPQFDILCEILRRHIPKSQCGLWCNNPAGKGRFMRDTFDPRVSNLNVHMDMEAYREFKRDWPESQPFGQDRDSRHSPCYVAIKDVVKTVCPKCGGLGDNNELHFNSAERFKTCDNCEGSGKVVDEDRAWDLISRCDINQHWSAMMGMFRGELRAWFCEIAGSQAMLHQHESDYPDTGVHVTEPTPAQIKEVKEKYGYDLMVGGVFSGHFLSTEPPIQPWWKLPMIAFKDQVRKHCFDCGVPLRGHGELALASDKAGVEQVSQTHRNIYHTKRKERRVELVTVEDQLGPRLGKMTDYLGNARR